jgi:hypothetical protein
MRMLHVPHAQGGVRSRVCFPAPSLVGRGRAAGPPALTLVTARTRARRAGGSRGGAGAARRQAGSGRFLYGKTPSLNSV